MCFISLISVFSSVDFKLRGSASASFFCKHHKAQLFVSLLKYFKDLVDPCLCETHEFIEPEK